MDEALDDCLVGASGSQGVHGCEVRSHQRGPETDGQVLTGHQVQLVVLAHPGTHRDSHFNRNFHRRDASHDLRLIKTSWCPLHVLIT